MSVRVLAAQANIRIIVFIADHNGKPIPNAKVAIQRKKDLVVQETDADGRLTEDVVLEVTRPYPLTVTATGYEPKGMEISAAELSDAARSGKPVQLNISLTTRASDSNEQSDTASVNAGQGAVTSTKSTRGEPDNRAAPKEEVSEYWFQPILDFFKFLFSFWWLALLIAVFYVVLVAWLKGYRVARFQHGLPVPSIRTNVHFIADQIEKIKTEIQTIRTRQEQVAGTEKIQATLEGIQRQIEELRALMPGPQGLDNARSNPPTIPSQYLTPYTSRDRVDYSPRDVRLTKENAQAAYAALARSEVVSPDPIYLKAEVRSSPMAMLEHDEVYLQEVPNTQGSFVLFAEADGRGGWVFPNPNVTFRPEALRPVFPNLGEMSETQFQSAKTLMNPARVNQLDAGRWIVE